MLFSLYKGEFQPINHILLSREYKLTFILQIGFCFFFQTQVYFSCRYISQFQCLIKENVSWKHNVLKEVQNIQSFILIYFVNMFIWTYIGYWDSYMEFGNGTNRLLYICICIVYCKIIYNLVGKTVLILLLYYLDF